MLNEQASLIVSLSYHPLTPTDQALSIQSIFQRFLSEMMMATTQES